MKLTFGLAALVCISMLAIPQARAGHPGMNWEEIEPDPIVRQWIATLMQPDTFGAGHPISCCGDSDAYWADKIQVIDDDTYAIVTDDRNDEPLHRPHVPIGTKFKIPPNKIVGEKQRGNPSGHAWLFLGGMMWPGGDSPVLPRGVLCFVPNGSF